MLVRCRVKLEFPSVFLHTVFTFFLRALSKSIHQLFCTDRSHPIF
jgi:hypothetical protein